MEYNEIQGNLITLAKQGKFDVIVHGCNCLCIQGTGLAPQMVEAFETDQFNLEHHSFRGDINKLGQIDYELYVIDEDMPKGVKQINSPWIQGYSDEHKYLFVVNAYTQYSIKPTYSPIPFDYEAFTLCMRKINHAFKGQHVGLPQIGAGLAKGDWNIIKNIIQTELKDCNITVVIYEP